jgi:hypothetical protein
MQYISEKIQRVRMVSACPTANEIWKYKLEKKGTYVRLKITVITFDLQRSAQYPEESSIIE